MAARLNRTPAECCALLGISQSSWSAWKKRGDQPIPSPTVALAIRLYDCFPELAPREPTPEELLGLLNQVTGQAVPYTRLAALLGRERTSGYRWTQRGRPSLPVSRLIGAVAAVVVDPLHVRTARIRADGRAGSSGARNRRPLRGRRVGPRPGVKPG